MTEMAIYPLQAAAVGVQLKAGVARVELSYDELLDRAEMINGAAATDAPMDAGCIPRFRRIDCSF